MKVVDAEWYQGNVQCRVNAWAATLGSRDILGVPVEKPVVLKDDTGFIECLCIDAEVDPAGRATVVIGGKKISVNKSELYPAVPKPMIFIDRYGEVEWFGIEPEQIPS